MHKKILLVDAYPSSREGLKASLRGEDCSVETVGDSWQAIKMMKESRFAVAIIDIDLPPVHGVSMNGWDLVRIFRAFDPSITLILVGADAGVDAQAHAEQVNVSELLEKPISPRQLKAIVQKIWSVKAPAESDRTRMVGDEKRGGKVCLPDGCSTVGQLAVSHE